MRAGGGFSIELLDERPGIVRLRVIGKNAAKAFKNESGLMQWQRIPPTEKRGRTHTSTITVAILPEIPECQIQIDQRDLEWKTTRGSGAGGQHRNVTDSAVQLLHKPTQLRVRCESARSQHDNKSTALQILAARLLELEEQSILDSYNDKRKRQVGTGHRGVQKIRTIRLQDDLVIDHQTQKRISAKKYFRGQIDLLY